MQSNTTGNTNFAVGRDSLYKNTTGSNNTASGYQALYSNTTSSGNTAIGAGAAFYCTNASSLVAVGENALRNTTTGTRNVGLGHSAGANSTTGNSNVSIGYDANPSSTTVSDQFTLGNSGINNLRCNDTSISSLSDERDKTNIVDIPLGLGFINTLRPVSFDWDRRDGSFVGKKDFGFIAQELKVAADATPYAESMRLVREDNPDKLEADPMKTYPILIKAIQELSAENKALMVRIEALENA
jgi:hypothetical protein